MTDPGNEEVEYNGVTMKVKDIPEAAVRVMMGYGHDADGRKVINVPGHTWETTPNHCTYGSLNWEWITLHGFAASAQYLVCPKCGLDGT